MKYLILFHISVLALAIDLIQIDVGTSKSFTGTLNMEATDVVDLSNHGTQMATALADELRLQKSKPVQARQLVWDRRSFNTILPALRDAYHEQPKVLSLSYGGPYASKYEEAFLFAHYLNDTLIIAAAGNEGGGTQYFPANYPNPCIVSVGTTIRGKRAPYSNDAMVWLEYNSKDLTGTSFSTARMAAIALQIRRNNPQLDCGKAALLLRMLYGH